MTENAHELAFVDQRIDVINGHEWSFRRLECFRKAGKLERDTGQRHVSFSICTSRRESSSLLAAFRVPPGAFSERRSGRPLTCLTYSVRHSTTCARTRRASSSRSNWMAVRGLGIATVTDGPIVARGPAVIGTIWSDSRRASSTVFVINRVA